MIDILYDSNADIAYIFLSEERKIARTSHLHHNDDIKADYGSDDEIIGIEVLNASAHLSEKLLEKLIQNDL